MASVLFSTVGQALGGPLGGAVGAIAGGGLDAALGGRRRMLAPEAGLPASSYAVPVPRLYGRTRTSGVLVWALPPTAGGGGKGGSGDRSGLVTSLAFLLSSRPVREIGRIWADGREIRNGAGEVSVSMVVRLHDGASDPMPDPVIVAAEGFDNAPAFRNFAYVVLENLALGGFGNRIPALSFEVWADTVPAGPGEWIEDLCRHSRIEAAVLDVPARAQGFATSAPAWREDIAELAALVGAEPGLLEGRFRIGGDGATHHVPKGDILLTEDPDADGGVTLATALDERPASWTLSYLDPDRDYQRGSQRAVSGERGRMVASGAAASLDASSARAAAERLLNDARAASQRLDLGLAWKWARVAPGDRVVLEGVNGHWRVVEREIAGLKVRLRCQSIATGALPPASGDPGRAILAPAVPPGATRLHVFEPPLSPRANAGPELLVLAAGGRAWKGAKVSISQADGGGVAVRSDIPGGAIHGTLLAPVREGPSNLWDEAASLDVALEDPDDMLEGRSFSAVLAGANLLLVGDELLQFRDAASLGPGRFRLRGLIRGRNFTAATGHGAGERCILLGSATALALPLTPDWLDRPVRIEATGPGDPAGGTSVVIRIAGTSLAPLAPCHLRVEPAGPGLIRISCVPRHRRTIDWSAEAEPPPPPYVVHLRRPGSMGPSVSIPAEGSSLILSPSALAGALGPGPGPVIVRIEALGDGPAEVRTTAEHLALF